MRPLARRPESDDSVHAGELLFGCGDADLNAFELAEPAFSFSFQASLREVDADLFEPGPLGGVGAQHRAADASVFMDAGSAIGATAGSEFDFAFEEVGVELVELRIGGCPVVVAGAQGSAPVDVGAEVADDVFIENGGVTLGGVDVLVAEEFGDDMDRQAGADRIGRKNPAEVVWGQPGKSPASVRIPAAWRAAVR